MSVFPDSWIWSRKPKALDLLSDKVEVTHSGILHLTSLVGGKMFEIPPPPFYTDAAVQKISERG